MPEVAAQNYFGSFNYEQGMAFDPSYSAVDTNVEAFGSAFGDFVTEESQTWSPDMWEGAKN
jgi:hypothetical protein